MFSRCPHFCADVRNDAKMPLVLIFSLEFLLILLSKYLQNDDTICKQTYSYLDIRLHNQFNETFPQASCFLSFG